MADTRRTVGLVMLAAAVAALAGLVIFWNAAPPPEGKLETLARDFMRCLPQDTTPAERSEIQGIMDRFCRNAMRGKVHPKDVVEIENDLAQFAGKGTISRDDLRPFLSKVGKATRRLDSGYSQPAD